MNFENSSIIGEDMDRCKVPRFLASPVELVKSDAVGLLKTSSDAAL